MRTVLFCLVFVVFGIVDASSDSSDVAQPWVDREGPRVETLEIDRQVVDVTNGSATVYVTVRVTDDLSGVAWGVVEFRSPSYLNSQGQHGQGASADAYEDQIESLRISGDELDGVYRIPMVIPQFAEAGEWQMVGHFFGDNVGNTSQPHQIDIGESDVSLEVLCDTPPDTAPPVLDDFTFQPSVIDVTEGSSTLEVILTITDDPSGLASIYFDFESESGQFISYGEGLDASEVRTIGSATDGTYTINVPIPEFAEGGEWTIRSIALADNAGNWWWLAEPELGVYFDQEQFPTTTFTVISNGSDTAPPVLRSVTIEPAFVDVSRGSATVSVTLVADDDRSGIIGGEVIFKSPTGSYWASAEIDDLVQSGNINGDTYRLELHIPQFTEVGIWTFDYLILRDAMENRFVLYAADESEADESEPPRESLEDYFDDKDFPRSFEVTATRISLRGIGRSDVIDSPLDYGLVKLSDVSEAGGDYDALSEIFGRPLEEFGLFTAQSIHDLNLGGLMLQKIGNSVTLSLEMQTSTNLSDWDDGDILVHEMEVPGDKWFIRVRALGPQ